MKTKVVTLMMTLILSAAFVYAGTTSDTDSVKANDAKIGFELNVDQNTLATLKIEKEPGEKMRVLLRSNNGEFLYTKRIKQYATAEITFDMQNLAEGKYEVQVFANGKKVYIQTIEKNTDHLSLTTEY